jgi:hypothetical protein
LYVVPSLPRLADVIGNGRDASEVGDRGWLDVEPLERPACKRQDNACLAGREDVDEIVPGHQPERAQVVTARDRLGRRSRPMMITIVIIMNVCA